MAEFIVSARIPAARLGELITAVTMVTDDFQVARAEPERPVIHRTGAQKAGRPTQAQVALLEKLPDQFTSKQAGTIYASLGYMPAGCSSILSRLCSMGILRMPKRGTYVREVK